MARQGATSWNSFPRSFTKIPWNQFLPSFKVRNKTLRPRQVSKEHKGVCHLQHKKVLVTEDGHSSNLGVRGWEEETAIMGGSSRGGSLEL